MTKKTCTDLKGKSISILLEVRLTELHTNGLYRLHATGKRDRDRERDGYNRKQPFPVPVPVHV